MTFRATLAALAVVLASCQGATSLQPSPSGETSVPAAARHAPNYDVCGSGQNPIAPAGGRQNIPHIANQNEFSGDFEYAGFTGFKNVQGLVFSCPTSDPIAPTPQGYTADWFGSWTLVCHNGCGGLTFDNAHLRGHIDSNSWSQSTTYYLYLYTLYTRQYIESYKIGPVHAHANGKSSLSFASPFENGFVYPPNEAFALEIVHPQ